MKSKDEEQRREKIKCREKEEKQIGREGMSIYGLIEYGNHHIDIVIH